MSSLAILISTVLVLSCGQTQTHRETDRITEAGDPYTHATTVPSAWVNSPGQCQSAPVTLQCVSTVVDPRVVCEAEKFQPMCADGEVVVMTEAMYGRMTIGRCVRTDYGYVSCGVNVLGYLDSKCSGRRSCELSIPDQGLKNVIAAAPNRCPHEFKTYLNASYDCYEGKSNTFWLFTFWKLLFRCYRRQHISKALKSVSDPNGMAGKCCVMTAAVWQALHVWRFSL